MNFKVSGVQETVSGLRKFGAEVPETLKEVLRKNFRKASAEARPKIPTLSGGAKRRFSFSVTGGTVKKGDIKGRIGFIRKAKTQSEAVAPHVFEKGATIRPKRGKFLWIPIGGNVDAAGHSKRKVQFTQMIVLKSRAGNLIAFDKLGPGEMGPPEPLFILRREVIVPKQPVIAPMEAKMVPAIQKDVDGALKELSKGV